MVKYLETAAVLTLVITFTSATAVGAKTCNSTSDCTGGSPAIANSVCNAAKKCECDSAFKEDAGAGACVAKVAVTATACKPNGTECSTIQHSNCIGSHCQCVVTHKQGESPNIDTCVPKAVSELSCNSGGKECDVVTNSACVGTKCQCTAAYKQGSGTAANTCVAKRLTDLCTAESECSGVSNAECAGETGKKACTCKANFKADNGKCNAANGLHAVLSAPVALLLSFLTIVVTRLH